MYKHFIIAVFCFLPVLAVAQEFGYINKTEVLQAMPETVESLKKLDDLAKNYEAELLIMQEEYQKKGSEFVAQRDSLPESIRIRRMTDIQDLEQRIQNFYQDSQEDIQRQHQELFIPINEKLAKAVKAVGEEFNMVYIFDISANNGLLYYSPSKCKDVTPMVRAKLGLK